MTYKLVDPYENFKKHVLSNGLTIYYLEVPQPWVQVRFLVHAGAKDDIKGKEGTAHFVEHQATNGFTEIKKKDFKEHFYKIGGSYRLGSTGYEDTDYSFSVPLEGDNLDYGLNYFGKVIFHSGLVDEIERERKVIIEEYKERFPTKFARDLLIRRRKILFEGQSLADFTRPLGNIDSINSITIQDLKEYYDRCYTPQNTTVIAGGGLPLEEFLKYVENSPLNIAKEGLRIEKPDSCKEIKDYSEKHIHISYKEILKDKPSQPDITLYTSFKGDTNNKLLNIAIDVINEVTFEEIREKRGWSYGGEADYLRFPEAYEAYVNIDYPWEYENEIEGVVDECIEIAISSKEKIEKHINRALNVNKIRDESVSDILKSAEMDINRYGTIIAYNQIIDEYLKIKVEDVQEVIKRFRKENRLTITFGS